MNNILQEGNLNEYLDRQLYKLLGKTSYATSKIKTILVLSGGGVKGIAHIGGLKAMQDLNLLLNIKTIAGSSVGALIGFLYNVGYTPDELYDFIIMFDLTKMKSVDPSKLLDDFGLDNGNKFVFLLEKMIEAKGINANITFKDLFKKTGITLIITASCMNDKQSYYFSHKYSPNMSVILAVRMSTAFPIYFSPINYENKMFLDGGCIDNYPIQLFKDNINSVIGFYLADTRIYVKHIKNTEEFLINLLQCLFEGVTCNNVKGFENFTITIKTPDIDVLKLDLTEMKKHDIYSHGYNTVLKWFNSI